MDIKQLKEYIYENNLVEFILEQIGCKYIKYYHNGNPDPYWTAANPDGKNRTAINVYNKPSLLTFNHTRDIGELADIISLVCYIKQLSVFEGVKYICDLLGISYYHDFNQDLPESLKITKLILNMQSNDHEIEEENKPLKPISEKILTYYKPYVNDLFAKDGISYETQREWEIGYDELTNRITIPIRTEIGHLTGVKGRLFKEKLEDWELKYIYLEPCAKSKILYGLHKTYPYIKREGRVFIGESEKFCMQLWDMGYYNAIGLGGKKVSRHQIEKLTRLDVDLVFCFDKDVTKKEIEDIADRFIKGVSIYYIYDEHDILGEKESPSDCVEKFEYLLKNCLFKIK